MRKEAFLLIAIVLFFCTYASSQDVNAVKVFEKDGNIYVQANQEEPLKLTNTGRDSEPKLYPNGKWVYFVRTFEGEMIGEQYYPAKGKKPEDGILKEELWRIDADGSNEKMLYKNSTAAIHHPSGYPYASLDNPQISPTIQILIQILFILHTILRRIIRNCLYSPAWIVLIRRSRQRYS